MALANIWTLAPVAAPGDERTLADWGITGAQVSFRSLAADSLSLQLGAQDALDHEPLWPWDAALILYRDSVPYFRGRVARVPRSGSGRAESASYEVRGVWAQLEEATYLQTWAAAETSTPGTAGQLTGRVLLGGGRTTRELLATVAAYATAAGVPLDIDTSALPELRPPDLGDSNRTIAQVISEIMRWHPDTSLACEHGPETSLLRAIPRRAAEAVEFALGAPPLESLSLLDRPDLVPDAVHVIYETSAPQTETLDDWSAESNPSAIQTSRRLVVARDVWPEGAPVTRRSLVVTLPGPDAAALDEAAAAPPPPPPQPHRQPVQTRPLPATGSRGMVAQRWWLDHSGLGALGITVNDIALPASSTKDIFAHTVSFANPEDVEQAPSAINPNSTPLFRPPSVDHLPRELVSGSLAEWMPGVRWAAVVVRCTIAIRASTVEELDAASRAMVERMGPRKSSVLGHPAYLIDAEVRTTGTTAKTRVYLQWPSASGLGGNAANPPAPNAGLADAAAKDAIIPGLARAMYEARAETHWEGDIELSDAEAGSARYLGRVANATGGRPAWATMRALVQSESVDLARGRTTLSLGPPQHLAPQDWADLHRAARAAQQSRALSAHGPKNPATGDYDAPPPPPPPPDDDPGDDAGGGGVFGAVSFAGDSFSTIGGGGAATQRWDLVPAGTSGGVTTFLVHLPEIRHSLDDVTAMASITQSAFAPVAGRWLVAKTTDFGTSYVIEQIAEWADFPSPYEFGVGATYALVAARFGLWQFFGADAEGRVSLGDGVYGKKMVRDDLLIQATGLVPVGAENQWRSVPQIL